MNMPNIKVEIDASAVSEQIKRSLSDAFLAAAVYAGVEIERTVTIKVVGFCSNSYGGTSVSLQMTWTDMKGVKHVDDLGWFNAGDTYDLYYRFTK